ncbi:DegT/DnrJ/EryC1/StrS aminotransferase family protein [Adlercreutzia sp. ZJ138]|uniref:DegT/DnrJ/EryC1/StrS family aminotransferase n=1 Tax=Adlercreutzia sp. ZJ138 TaxID=2709405 RepID=UPI001F1534CA|nr:DegT/DnrJ/EryC1/StrS family aminotransferase [Adlercreutzia sp. ZJ138]
MKSMQIMPNNLKRQYDLHAEEYRAKVCEVLDSGWYVLGREVVTFESEWAAYVGTAHCAGVASGLDALIIAFRILGIHEGDEVIVAANAYIACVMGITINGGTPAFVEPDEYNNIDVTRIEEAVTPRTKAILAVHLFGQCCDMDAIREVADRHSLYVVEDCAQAHGNHWHGKRAGSLGDISCFSFYPSKGCGAFGDGGALCTNSPEWDAQARVIRNYGSERRYHNSVVGMNSRLDEIQAGLLRVKMRYLDEMNEERCAIAAAYNAGISNPLVIKPKVRPGADSSWHQYVIHVRGGKRDALKEFLAQRGVGTIIHYPIPPHLSEAYRYLGFGSGSFPIAERAAGEVLSLPMYNGMTAEEQSWVIESVNAFEG